MSSCKADSFILASNGTSCVDHIDCCLWEMLSSCNMQCPFAESTSAAVQSLHAPEVSIKAITATKKKGAVIGSAPKLSHEGLVAAAKAAEEKVAAEAAAVKKASQAAAKKAAAEAAKARRQKPKLAPAGTGIGFQAGPAQSGAALTSEVLPEVPAPMSATDSQLASGTAGAVQGKIYQGKWSRKK